MTSSKSLRPEGLSYTIVDTTHSVGHVNPSLRGLQFAGSIQRRILRNSLAPDIKVEPVQVRLQQRASRFRLVHSVPESGVENQPRRHSLILQASVQFKTVRHRHALVVASLLN